MHETPAFILRSTTYKESDLILLLLTRDLGAITAMARGGKRSHKRFGGALAHYALFNAFITEERKGAQFHVLKEASLVEEHLQLATDLQKMGAASFIIELIKEVAVPEEGNPSLFHILKNAFALLNRKDALNVSGFTLAVIGQILHTTGLGICLERCAVCGTTVPQKRTVYFNPSRGGVVCTACGGGPLLIGADTLSTLRLLDTAVLNNKTIDELSHMDSNKETTQQAFDTVQAFLTHHLDKDLNTTSYRMILKKS